MPILSGVILFIVSVAALSYRHQRTSLPIIIVGLASAIWCFGYAFEVCAADQLTAIFWANIQYMGLTCIGPGIFLLGLLYSQTLKITGRWVHIIPFWQAVLILPVVWTNAAHELFRRGIGFSAAGAVSYLSFEKGPVYLLNLGFTYIQILIGLACITRMAIGKNNLYRKQTRIMLVGIATPFLGNIGFML